MFILHALTKAAWESARGQEEYGQAHIDAEGFIHCSDIHTFAWVAPNFRAVEEPMVLLVINTEKVKPEIKWEDGDNCGVAYPHIYGVLNVDAVVEVLPYLRDECGDWVPNEELAAFAVE